MAVDELNKLPVKHTKPIYPKQTTVSFLIKIKSSLYTYIPSVKQSVNFPCDKQFLIIVCDKETGSTPMPNSM